MNLKKILTSALVLFAIMIPISCAYASAEFSIGEYDVYSFENTLTKTQIDAAPYVKNYRTMVPVRAVCEIFGCDVSWDGEAQSVSITKGENNVILNIGSNVVYANGKEQQIDCAPEITENRTFVPLRVIGENLGYYVYYISSTGQIIIDEQMPVMNIGQIQVPYSVAEAMYNNLYLTSGADKASLVNQIYSFLTDVYVLCNNAQTANISLSDAEILELQALNEKIKQSDISEIGFLPAAFVKLQQDYIIANKCSKEVSENLNITDEEIKTLYADNYVCVKHVLITCSDENDEEAQKIANEVYDRAVSGENFDLLIEQYGEDPGMQSNPSGYVFTYNEMVKEFEEKSFELEIGEISKPVKTSYGYHVILKLPLPEDKNSIENVRVGIESAIFYNNLYEIYVNTDITVNITENAMIDILGK